MGLNASKVKYKSTANRVEQPLLPAGGYPGRLVQIIDFGLQPQRAFQGKEKPPAYMIGLTFEMADEFMVDKDGNILEDKPRWISEKIPFYGLDQDKAKSTQRYKALDPTVEFGGDWPQLLGKACLINVVINPKDGKEYSNIGSLSTLRPKDAEKVAPLVNKPVAFALDEPDLEVFNSFPEWIQNDIKSNLEYNGSPLQALLGEKPKAQTAANAPTPQVEDGEDDTDWADSDADEQGKADW